MCGVAINSGKEKGGFCKAKPVEGHKMEEYVSAAWAQLVSQRENLLSGWEKDIAQGNALERLRAAQMKELTESILTGSRWRRIREW